MQKNKDNLLEFDLLKQIMKQDVLKRYAILFFALFFAALTFNLLTLPSSIVPGGINGVAIVMNYVYEFPPSLLIFGASFILLIFSYMYLGKEKTMAALVGTIAYAFFVEVSAPIVSYINIDLSDLLLISIFIGVLTGIYNGLIFKTGFNAGGLPILIRIIHEKTGVTLGTSGLIVNGIIIAIGSLFFGLNMLMYALIINFIASQIIDRVVIGISKNKAFYIVTDKYKEVNNFIMNDLNRTVTIFNVKGGFLEKRRKVLLVVIPTREYFKFTAGIKLIDKDAFFLASDAYQVQGGK